MVIYKNMTHFIFKKKKVYELLHIFFQSTGLIIGFLKNLIFFNFFKYISHFIIFFFKFKIIILFIHFFSVVIL